MTKSIGPNPGHAATYYAASARDKRVRPSLDGQHTARRFVQLGGQAGGQSGPVVGWVGALARFQEPAVL